MRLWNTVAVLALESLYWFVGGAWALGAVAVVLAAMYWFMRLGLLVLDGMGIDGAWKAGIMFAAMILLFLPVYAGERRHIIGMCARPASWLLRRIAGKSAEFRRRGAYRFR